MHEKFFPPTLERADVRDYEVVAAIRQHGLESPEAQVFLQRYAEQMEDEAVHIGKETGDDARANAECAMKMAKLYFDAGLLDVALGEMESSLIAIQHVNDSELKQRAYDFMDQIEWEIHRKIIEGERVLLREGLTEQNLSKLLELFTDLESVKDVSFAQGALALKTVDDLKELLSWLETGPIFGIYDKEERFIGYTSLSDYVGKSEAEFSIFVLDPDSRSRGIGAETTRLMLHHAFYDLHLEKVTLETGEFHEKALQLYEHSGFKRTRLVPNDRTVFRNGAWVKSGSVFMEITKEMYELREKEK